MFKKISLFHGKTSMWILQNFYEHLFPASDKVIDLALKFILKYGKE